LQETPKFLRGFFFKTFSDAAPDDELYDARDGAQRDDGDEQPGGGGRDDEPERWQNWSIRSTEQWPLGISSCLVFFVMRFS
jgi:hypothetical protein